MPLHRERARNLMQKAGVDALAASSPTNVYYVSDYHSTGMQLGARAQNYALLPLDGEPALVAPLGEADIVAQSGTWIKNVEYYGCLSVNVTENSGASEVTRRIVKASQIQGYDTSCDALTVAVTKLGLAKKTIALDQTHLSPFRLKTIKENLPDVKFVDGTDLLELIRSVKTGEEIARIQRATEITEKSMEDALEILQPEIMELDLAGMFNYSVTEDGGRVTLDYIGFGERSAYPSPIPTAQVAKKGDLIRLVLGAAWAHYNGNITRTAAVGKASPEAERRLSTVIDAQEAAFDAIKPGVALGGVYSAIRKEFDKAGIKECGNSLGHCLGIECNERPWVLSGSDVTLEEGMVLNIEVPYLDLGWGGISLEDTVQVTKKGFKLLTNTERTLYLI